MLATRRAVVRIEKVAQAQLNHVNITYIMYFVNLKMIIFC